jgi:hypothetical protein
MTANLKPIIDIIEDCKSKIAKCGKEKQRKEKRNLKVGRGLRQGLGAS